MTPNLTAKASLKPSSKTGGISTKQSLTKKESLCAPSIGVDKDLLSPASSLDLNIKGVEASAFICKNARDGGVLIGNKQSLIRQKGSYVLNAKMSSRILNLTVVISRLTVVPVIVPVIPVLLLTQDGDKL